MKLTGFKALTLGCHGTLVDRGSGIASRRLNRHDRHDREFFAAAHRKAVQAT